MNDQAARLRELLQARPNGGKCRTIVVTSGKGGVGKTNLTVNLALALARNGKRVVLFDADLGMANVDVILNMSPPLSLADVIAGNRGLSEVLFPVEENFWVVPGGSGVANLASLGAETLASTVSKLGELESRADYLLVDTGAGISPNVLGFVLAAPEILVVTTPEPTAIVDAYGIIKTIDSRNKEARVQLLVNMADSEAEARSVHAKLSGIIARFLSIRVSLLGWVEKDPSVGRSVLLQQPFLRAFPNTLATKRIQGLARAMIAEQASGAEAPREGFFARLGRSLFG